MLWYIYMERLRHVSTMVTLSNYIVSASEQTVPARFIVCKSRSNHLDFMLRLSKAFLHLFFCYKFCATVVAYRPAIYYTIYVMGVHSGKERERKVFR